MSSYWLSFRLHDSDGWETTYDDRLSDLHSEIEAASGGGDQWWCSTTSFYIFESDESIDTIVFRVKRAISEKVDLVVIGMNHTKDGRVVGYCADYDIFSLVPFMTKV